MTRLRALFRNHRTFAAMLLALALAMKALVPGGYMVRTDAIVLTVGYCNEGSSSQATVQISIPKDSSTAPDHSKTDAGCAFSALSMASLSAADAPLLALALLFILAIGLHCPQPFAPTAFPYLRPHLRGPPHTA